MPVPPRRTDLPTDRGLDEVLRLVYAKAAAISARRRRRRGRGLAPVLFAFLVLGALGEGVVGMGGSHATAEATYAMPASLPTAARLALATNLTRRFRALGHPGAKASLSKTWVSVDWSRGGRIGAPVLAQLGGAGILSVRPVIGSHAVPCQAEPPAPARGSSFEVTSPNNALGCLALGPAELVGLQFQATRAVRDPDGRTWDVAFVVAPLDARAFDAFAARHLHQEAAVLVDNVALTAPMINATSFGGRGRIAGSFDRARAQALAVALRYQLPLTVSVEAVH